MNTQHNVMSGAGRAAESWQAGGAAMVQRWCSDRTVMAQRRMHAIPSLHDYMIDTPACTAVMHAARGGAGWDGWAAEMELSRDCVIT